MLVYVPMKILIKLDIEKHVKEICEEMEIFLNKRKNWSNTNLFLDFTHILIRHKWWNDLEFKNTNLLEKYDKLCEQWYNKYGIKTIQKFNTLTLTELRQIKSSFLSKLDFSLQFLKLLKLNLSDTTREQIKNLIMRKHNKQTEHIYMLSIFIE